MSGIYRGIGTSGTGVQVEDVVLTKVAKAGDTMTGYLNVPAGATGTQAPQSQEVTHVTTLAAAGGALLVGNTPAGNIAATTVQAALNELDTEKALLAGSATQVFSAAAATAVSNVTRADQIQAQSVTAFTTAGTSTAYTLTPTPAISAYEIGQEFDVIFNAACGATPTISISGLAAVNLVDRLADGTYYNIPSGRIPINWRSKCVMVSLTQMLVRETPCESISSTILIASAISILTSTASNITTITIPAGDWEIFGNITFIPTGTTTVATLNGSISATSATIGSEQTQAQLAFQSSGLVMNTRSTMPLSNNLIHLTASTNYYLVGYAIFATSTLTVSGSITARRYK